MHKNVHQSKIINAQDFAYQSSLRATDFIIIYFMREFAQIIHIFCCVSIGQTYRQTCCQVGSSVLMIVPNGESTMALVKNYEHLGDTVCALYRNRFHFVYMKQLSAILLCWTSLSLNVGSSIGVVCSVQVQIYIDFVGGFCFRNLSEILLIAFYSFSGFYNSHKHNDYKLKL